MERLTDSCELKEDIANNIQSIRPKFLKDYIGQQNIKEQLNVFIASAKKRKTTLDHVLIFGPPGLGKTTLANIIANEMSVQLHSCSGPTLAKPGDLAAILTNLNHGDILFIDEIHRLSSHIEEILYPAMEDFQLDIIIGEGPSARSIKVEVPKFTLIAATTKAGSLTSPLRDRFGILFRLNFYDTSALVSILKRAAKILNITIAPDAALNIAERSRGTPRIANRLLKRVRDYAIISTDKNTNYDITKNLSSESLTKLEVDKYGLDILDRRVIAILIEQFHGGPCGIDAISATLGECRDTIEDIIEPFLLQNGFITRTPRGRQVTQKARDHYHISNNLFKEGVK